MKLSEGDLKNNNGSAGENNEKYQRGKHEERKNHILDVAFTIFLEKGYANTRVADIAHAAGFGKSTLYEYFGSKDEILTELFRVKLIDRYENNVASIDPKLTPWEKITALLNGVIEIILEYGADERLVTTLMAHPEYIATPALFENAQKIMKLHFETISAYIMEGKNDGSFNVQDHGTAASLIIGATSSYLGMVTAPELKQLAADLPDEAEDEDARRSAFFAMIYRTLRSDEDGSALNASKQDKVE